MNPAPRLRSLDLLRGGAVAGMIVVNNPGSWDHLYPPLAHAAWHGVTPTDLVFPFFLFAVGAALAMAPPTPGRLLRRTLVIFGVGLLLNAAPFVRWDAAAGEWLPRPLDTLRLLGVLQRIALAWCAAALVVRWWGRRGAWIAGAALLVGYWIACLAFGDAADPYGREGFFGTALDRRLLGAAHLYRGEGVPFDPEGLASTLPAVAQVLIGWLAGDALRRAVIDDALLVRLFVAACALLALAWLWQLEMPFNKKIWSSSYVLLTSGLAVAALALLLRAVEQRGGDGVLIRLGEAFGRQALVVYVASALVPRLLTLMRWRDGVDAEGRPRWITPLPWAWRTAGAPLGDALGDPRLASLGFALVQLALYAALAWALERRALRWRA